MDALLSQLPEFASRGLVHATIDLAAAPKGLRYLGIGPERAHCLFEGALVDDGDTVAPWLVGQISPGLLRLTQDVSRESPAVTWIVSSLPVSDLARRLRRRIDAVLPGDQSAILRYYDPRVLHELAGSLSGATRADMFSLGTQWLYMDRDACLRSIELQLPDGPDPLKEPLMLDPATESALVTASEAGQALRQASECAPALMLASSAGQRFELAKRCVLELESADVDSFPATVGLLVIAADRPAQWLDSQEWQASRARISANPACVEEVLAALADEAG